MILFQLLSGPKFFADMILLLEPMVARSEAEIQQSVQPCVKDKVIWVDFF